MSSSLPVILLARHGETAWSLTGQHTGSRTDLPLTERGARNAKRLGERLQNIWIPHVYVSPLQRARQTCDLAGFGAEAEVDPDLVEWDYGDYEGLTTPQIRQSVPGWTVWTHPCPGGESMADVTARADAAVELALGQMVDRDVVFVGHGHFSRSMLTRWIELPVSEGIRLSMAAASIAVCGFEHGVRQITALGLTGHVNPCLPA